MATRLEILQELDRRKKLPANLQPAFEEAVRRGLVQRIGQSQEQEQPLRSGGWNNFTAGLNNSIYATAGAPVDLARTLINDVTQSREGEDLPPDISPMAAMRAILSPLGIPEIPDDTVGGRKWVSDRFEGAGVNDPDRVVAANDVEKLLRATGEGVGATIAPEAALASVASRAPTLGTNLLKTILGDARSAGSMARNATMGGVGNASAQAAAESDAIPDWLKPVASLAAGVTGAGAAGAVLEAPNLVRQGMNVARSAIEAMTPAGQEQIVGRTLIKNADDPDAVLQAIDETTGELVPGSKPTTFQQTGDMGLGQMERVARNRDPAAFNVREAEQNTARMTELESIQPNGAPEKVAQAVRSHIEGIQKQADDAIAAATKQAQQATEALGRGKSPDEVGASIRSALEKTRTEAMERENALWQAVDPDRSLALPAPNVRQHLTRIVDDIPASAKAPSGEEAAIYDVLRQYGEVLPFREMNAMRSRLAEAMRDELERHGQKTVAWGRMTQLNDALWKDIEVAVTQKVAQQQVAVAKGELDELDTIAANVMRQFEEFRAGREAQARAGSGEGISGLSGSGQTGLSRPFGTEASRVRRPANAARDPRLSGDGLGANFDQAALDRLNAAREATQDRVNTFDNRVLAPIQRRPSDASVYPIGDTAIPQKLFFAGPSSKDAIRQLKSAIGNERAMVEVKAHAAQKLRKEALGDDLILDPNKLRNFPRRYSDALSEFPNLNSKIGTAEKAGDLLAQTAKDQKARVDDVQKGKLGEFFGLEDPEDVQRTVASIFKRQDAVAQMRRVRETIKGDKEAVAGLRKAIIDTMLEKLVSTTEAATTGIGTMKTDMFQRFVRQNEAALSAAGFSDNDLLRFRTLASDLQRANRSISAVKLKGQSNTAQDQYGLALGSDGETTMLMQLVVVPAVSAIGSKVGGWAGAAAGALGTAVAHRAYMSGIDSTQALLRDTLLDPTLARALMMRVKPQGLREVRARLRELWTGANSRTFALGLEEENRGGFAAVPAMIRRALQARASEAHR
ncbi:MAG: hypothetical protein KIS86_02670 [Devosia sp.]|nr:hypothetical protein [Devosia sp.]